MPIHLERLRLRLQPLRFNVKFESGINNPTDYLSRCIINDVIMFKMDFESQIDLFVEVLFPKAIMLQKIQAATETIAN